ncbi:membrane protein [Tersicoccus solisilvae]|uniref:Membrane protein n=1 Tax=Tersicoccus solisilvae TaxID=1882339 RepID=A0ABQ1P9K7_9MICC|nr:PH domain-containing protein [Tersicoccus solisilvae]GGC93645.1 membrane protein [Tersicoccus solisilvae]
MRSEPIDPEGLTFTGVSPRLVWARALGWLPAAVLIVAVCSVPLVLTLLGVWTWVPRWLAWAVPVVALVVQLWRLALIPRQVRALGYAERDEDLLIRSGLFFRRLVVVPYGRMQYVDVQAGPVERALGMAGIKLHTASASTDAAIPGLPADEAARLREALSARGEARLAGL